MPRYRYRAINEGGNIVKGEITALHEADLRAQLTASGLSLIRFTTARSGGIRQGSLPTRELINLLFHMQMLLRAGVPLMGALQDLRDGADNLELRQVAAGLIDRIQNGSTLADAMAADPGIFSEVMVHLVRSGEVTGQLSEVLGELVRSQKWQSELASQTKKLIMYPAFVTITITGVVVFLMVYLVPQLVGFIRNMGQEVPLQTRMLIWLSNAFVNYWWLILPTPIALIFGVAAAARANVQFRFKLHQATLSIPIVGPVIKKIILARMTDSFALMYRTGIPVIEALSYCVKITTNLPIQQALIRARERIANGNSISDAFAAESLFPSLVVRMLRVGESTGALDEALANVSYFFTRDIDESIERVQALIEPVLTVVLGLILGWIMLAVLGPIYDTISKIRA
ncbi:MAG: type II secretion system F family protein [Aquabacterium sp.]|jgi:type IV pilus assembly protein PilC|uniref:type II secretion system F family protein n=1 Tax=Aquabacterium sp. TaxID=1872578 RepID=UPI001B6A9D62|nr:type II secretion system F family protein [Aquabacterium sp.]MBP7132244.1 type II secretion system F family protein [Aquabacterium sp.]MBP9063735.1 type II secretion system F family protein [Aquabacterium sp.]MDQ5926671.1 type pilus assembly protein PilC [Pseudomonadota bacterium]